MTARYVHDPFSVDDQGAIDFIVNKNDACVGKNFRRHSSVVTFRNLILPKQTPAHPVRGSFGSRDQRHNNKGISEHIFVVKKVVGEAKLKPDATSAKNADRDGRA